MAEQMEVPSLNDMHDPQLGEGKHHHVPAPVEIASYRRELVPSNSIRALLSPSSALSPSTVHNPVMVVQEDEKVNQDDVQITISRHTEQEGMDAAALQQVIDKIKGTTYPLGLSAAEASERLQRHGANEITEKKPNPVLKFLRYFWGPIAFMIEAAAILSAVLASWPDFAIIVVLLLVNGIIGFWEEYNAGNAVAALRQNIPRTAKVRRDDVWIDCQVEAVTVGDVVSLKLGDRICADGVIVKIHPAHPLLCDQSALTGESKDVKRRLGGKLLSGAIVKEGEAECMVTEVGPHTFIGKAAVLVNASRPSGHFQKVLTNIGNFLMLAAFIMIAVIVAYGVTAGLGVTRIIEFCLVLAIASIPVALPTVLSVTMAIGARELSRRNAVCTRLTAVEELSGIDVLCCDKTGTLTKNELTADVPISFSDDTTSDEIMLVAALAANLHHQEAIDKCVVNALGKNKETIFHQYKQIDIKPFNPVWKRAESIVECEDGTQWICSKGAPQVETNCHRSDHCHYARHSPLC